MNSMATGHQMSVHDFLDCTFVARLCGQHGNGVNKAIDVLTDPVKKRVWYEVTSVRREIYVGQELSEALEHYNAA